MESHPTRRQAAALILSTLILPGLPRTRADETEALVKDIRERYNQIEGAKLRPVELEFTSDSDPVSGTFTRYYRGDELVKVKLSYAMGDHGGSDEYFYYQNGQLFFAVATDTAWGFSGETLPNGESGTIDTAIEHRVYFSKGILIRHLSREVKSKDPDALAGLLAKATNRPATDTERGGRLYAVGQGAATANDGAAILGLLLQ